MGKLTDDQIRQIIQKASLLQKFEEGSSSYKSTNETEENEQLFEISDELGIPRKFVQEAYLEHAGIPVQEPLVIDNNDFNSTEVVGFAHGAIDPELFNELQAQIEYHFNTRGKITHRRNKVIWKATPVGPSKFIASSNSPEVEFEQVDGNTIVSIKQSLKTLNKLYLPGIAAAIGSFIFLAAILFNRAGNDAPPFIIISVMFLLGSIFFTRLVNNRRTKKKKNLQELSETLQVKIERHFKARSLKEPQKEIEILENEYEEDDFGETSKPKVKE